uniref:Uncharacterized protein n=1 Tax=Anguilla anguilla TaxID=7936 RepID=A0A0E9W5R0_ANGAN
MSSEYIRLWEPLISLLCRQVRHLRSD